MIMHFPLLRPPKEAVLTFLLFAKPMGKLVSPFQDICQVVVEQFPQTKIGVHCHNDAGVGVAVSLAGIEAGAVMVQGTMNGYGERNGNANLTTIIPNLELKMERSTNCGKNLSKLRDLSLFIDDSTNLRPDMRAPYVGAASLLTKEEYMPMPQPNPPRSYSTSIHQWVTVPEFLFLICPVKQYHAESKGNGHGCGWTVS